MPSLARDVAAWRCILSLAQNVRPPPVRPLSLPRGRLLRVRFKASSSAAVDFNDVVAERNAAKRRSHMSIRQAAAELPVLLGIVAVIAAYFLL